MTKEKALLGVLASIAAGTIIGLFLSPNKNIQLLKRSSHGNMNTKFDELLKTISTKLQHIEAAV